MNTNQITAAEALSRFRLLREENRLEMETAAAMATEAARGVIDEYLDHGSYLRESVQLLCEMTALNDERIARCGLTGLFPSLVERLNDSFDPAACRLYDLVFSQVIAFYRRLPGGGPLDAALNRFGIADEAALLARKARLADLRMNANLDSIRKVMLLSRVTIGADVMINGTLIAGARQILPNAEFILLGSVKLRELYGGDPGISIREIRYERGGTVLSRLLSWLDVVAAVERETAGLNSDEYLLIDPDSRLTQLGLLPLVTGDRSYLYFESRSWPGAGSLGRLASDWLGSVTGHNEQAFPFIALPGEHLRFGEEAVAILRNKGHKQIVTISLGVGGNESKRVSDEFEEDLIERRSGEAGIILDKGATASERDQIDRLVLRLRASGKAVHELNEGNLNAGLENLSADVVTWDGGIGRFAGLIAASDQYIGYDYAGQHIAAALGTPCLTIFVNSGSEVFAQRWRPYGNEEIEIDSRQ